MNPYAVPLSELERGTRVPAAQQVTEQSEPRRAQLVLGPLLVGALAGGLTDGGGAGGAAGGCDAGGGDC